MVGNLKQTEIEELLQSEAVGRIGCYGNEKVYVVPIGYVYHDGKIYCHTDEGLKVQIMRWNPHVCFEVDDTRDMGNWKSVIAWGTFKELQDEERTDALKLLINRKLPIVSSLLAHLGSMWPFIDDDTASIKGVVFSINIREITGRFERIKLFESVPS